jgi:very-short-patch-repair endonuclease
MFLFFLCLVFLCGTATFRTVPSSEASYETARRLRREQTPAEQILWRHLRGKRMCNVKFRRQHPIGPYFVDFCSVERNLILEVDGGQHAEQSADDETRSSFLRSHGYRVLRFWNHRVLANTNEVLDEIENVLTSDPRNLESRADRIAR